MKSALRGRMADADRNGQKMMSERTFLYLVPSSCTHCPGHHRREDCCHEERQYPGRHDSWRGCDVPECCPDAEAGAEHDRSRHVVVA
eukprot:scaffold20524_cov37-Phaeocystis_antarctica.AAC.3